MFSKNKYQIMNILPKRIKTVVDEINWTTPTKERKALEVCIAIYNIYHKHGGDFHVYRSLGYGFFKKIIKTKSYIYEIKNLLIENNILEMDNSYNVSKGIGKGYRFNNTLIEGDVTLCYPNEKLDVTLCYPKNTINELIINNQSINQEYISKSSLNLLTINQPSHHCYPNAGMPINTSVLEKLNFDEKVYNFINNYNITRKDILINEEIKGDYLDVILDNGTYRYKRENAFKEAKSLDLDIIQHKDKCYIDLPEDFLTRKNREVKIIYKRMVYEIENNIYRISRNETNRRLDYNLTNMKSDLINYLDFDGEKLVEIDISNAQFSVLSFIADGLDDEFITKSQNGTLYGTGKKRKENKKEWFRIAFDKIKENKFDSLYPKTMKYINDFKKQYGYKTFSILLQNFESLIMIDGLVKRLYEKGFEVLPVHDAVRVKESQVELIKKEIEIYFNEIDFVCDIRNKNDEPSDTTKEEIKPLKNDDDDFWADWNPIKHTDEVVDRDYGNGNSIDGFIESVSFGKGKRCM
jgi:hypothetical protein